MSRIPNYAFVLALCVFTSGCIPWRCLTRPGLSAQVVNAGDHQPIADATISIGTNAAPEAVSAADGTFTLQPKKGWCFVLLLPHDPPPPWIFPELSISVRRSGYEMREMTFAKRACEDSREKPLVISLEPEK